MDLDKDIDEYLARPIRYYEYKNRLENQPRICVSESDVENLSEHLHELTENDFEENCQSSGPYIISREQHCSSLVNFVKAYTHFVNKTERTYEIICAAPECGNDIVLENVGTHFNILFVNERFKEFAEKQTDGSIIVANVSIAYTNQPGHHLLAEIRKESFHFIITVFDTRCTPDPIKLEIANVFKTIYKEIVNIFDVQFHVRFAFDEFSEKKALSFQTDYQFTLEEFDGDVKTICENSRLQLDEGKLYGVGYCVGWTLYFLHQLYVEGKTAMELYEELDEVYNKAAFIYIWHDLFFSKVLGDPEVMGDDLIKHHLSLAKYPKRKK